MSVTVLGLVPLLIAFGSTFIWAYRFAYPMIPKLFGASTTELNRDINISINLDEDPLAKSHNTLESSHLCKFYRIMFSLSVALSVNMIKLILCEIIDFSDKASRLVVIQLDLNILTSFLTLIQPFIIIYINLNNWIPFFKLRVILGVTVYVSWLLLLHKIGTSASVDQTSFFGSKVSEISIIGITAMACLSGVGSVSTPYFSFLEKAKLVTETDIGTIADTINTTNNLIGIRKSELSKLQLKAGGTIYHKSFDELPSKQNKFRGFLSRVQSFSSVGMSQETELVNEIEQLQKMAISLQKDLKNVTLKFNEQKNSFTWRGRLTLLSRKGFSIYCAYRIINVLFIRMPGIYIFNNTSTEGIQQDALAVTIAKLIESLFTIPESSEDALVNELSFILSGGLFIGSFSSVLYTFSSFSKISSIDTKAKPYSLPLKATIISQLVGTYILSTALLLRSNLPISLSRQVSDALGQPLQVDFIDLWFDKIFALSCVCTVIGLYIKNHIDSDYDEKSA